jgi:hypothetical protein
MLVYSAGFIAIQLVFVLMYLRAYSRRNALDLGTHELSVTREEIQGYLLNVAVGLASMAIALVRSIGRTPRTCFFSSFLAWRSASNTGLAASLR